MWGWRRGQKTFRTTFALLIMWARKKPYYCLLYHCLFICIHEILMSKTLVLFFLVWLGCCMPNQLSSTRSKQISNHWYSQTSHVCSRQDQQAILSHKGNIIIWNSCLMIISEESAIEIHSLNLSGVSCMGSSFCQPT